MARTLLSAAVATFSCRVIVILPPTSLAETSLYIISIREWWSRLWFTLTLSPRLLGMVLPRKRGRQSAG